MSQTSFILDKPVLSVHSRIFGVLLTLSLSPRSITKQIAAASILCRNFEKIIWKMHPDSRWILFWISNHVLSRFYLRERIHNPVSITRSSWKDKQMGFE